MKYLYCATALALLLSASSLAQSNPIPTVDGHVSPQAVLPGSTGFTLTVRGAGFVPGAVVNWNGAGRGTTFISAGELQAQIQASDVAIAGSALITVINPPPGGGFSSSSYGRVEIHQPTSTMLLDHPHHYSNGSNPNDIVGFAADLNGDNKLDLVQTGSGIEVLLGNGDGTFSESDFIPHVAGSPQGLNFGDFNNDGKEDFIFVQPLTPRFVHVCLGDGTGKFQQQVGFGKFNGPEFPVVGDFNRDGNLDIVLVDTGVFYILFGKGDGTFQPQQAIASVGGSFTVAADFNGDGILDLAAFGGFTQAFVVLLGNGDGTFQPPISTPAAAPLVPLQVDDFNGDGKLDLAFASSSNQIGVLLGNGDGSFQTPQFYNVFHASIEFATGDFNSDGKSDLLAYRATVGAIAAVLIGNGDGTFQPRTAVNLPGPLTGHGKSVLGDFNCDGLLDFAAATGGAEVFVQKPQ